MSTVGLGRDNKLPMPVFAELPIRQEGLQELNDGQWESMSMPALVKNSAL